MSRIKRFMVISCWIAIGAFVAWSFFKVQNTSAQATTEGDAALPVVKIVVPKDKAIYKWDTLVNYEIVVSDRGKSTKYQEIPSNEVLLKTMYIPDLSRAHVNSPPPAPESSGLTDIMRSNCLGCHEFKSRAMGPSFAVIAKRYPDTASTIDTLSQHIREGSAGAWGQAQMPPHADLTAKDLHDISFWIMNHAADPDVNYYVGTEGSFSMKAPVTPGPGAGILLTASYTRPDAEIPGQQIVHGEDTIVVEGK